MECSVWSAKCGSRVCSAKCGVESVKWRVWSVACGVRSVEWRL